MQVKVVLQDASLAILIELAFDGPHGGLQLLQDEVCVNASARHANQAKDGSAFFLEAEWACNGSHGGGCNFCRMKYVSMFQPGMQIRLGMVLLYSLEAEWACNGPHGGGCNFCRMECRVARTIYIQCIHGIFGRGITEYKVIYVYVYGSGQT